MPSKRKKRARTREMDARDWIWCRATQVDCEIKKCFNLPSSFQAPPTRFLGKSKGFRRRALSEHSTNLLGVSLSLFSLIVVVAILSINVKCQHDKLLLLNQFGSKTPAVDWTSRGSPVILKTEQNQLFRGLRERALTAGGGRRAQDVISFLGIRYASAPIRRLRFMPPTPFTYAPGKQVHEARAFGPICPQRLPIAFSARQGQIIGRATNTSKQDHLSADLRKLQLQLMADLLPGKSGAQSRRFKKLLELQQSEDCLSLNIFAPLEVVRERLLEPPEVGNVRASEQQTTPLNALDEEKLRPVLVVIHGDSFDYGAGATISGARHFARDNNLLVVTFNFRLNLLGFPPTSGTDSSQRTRTASATRNNLGLLDQVALLHWLRLNVRSFGGSPQNVTLLGLRRGAVFVNLLMMSPLAKGLFQRAILEDGTALQANSDQNNLHVQQQQQQVAWQHLRLLALLAECPNTTTTKNLGDALTFQQQADWLSANNNNNNQAALECLRTSALETLVQPIPFGLLDASASISSNELVLAKRWLKPLATFLKLNEQGGGGGGQQQALFVDGTNLRSLNELAKRLNQLESSSNSFVQISASQLDQLIALLVLRKQQQQNDDDDLLSAIYLPSNETLAAPPFAPQLELVATSELLEQQWDLMRAPQPLDERLSPFGQHDLLLGSSQPLLDALATKTSGGGDSSQPLLHPLERFSKRVTQTVGLTDEQALQQVSLFVRAHFRFHQQEIANSIVSNYFLNGQLALAEEAGQEEDFSQTRQQEAAHEPLKVERKQLHLLRSLEGAYRDALISVPLIKTALIHSLRQLKLLGQLFAHKLASNFLVMSQVVETNNETSLSNEQVASINASSLAELELEQEFQKFARDLYEQPQIWPLELAQTKQKSLNNINQTKLVNNYRSPRATYLYQVAGADLLMGKLHFALSKLDSFESSNTSKTLLASLRRNLDENLLKKLQIHKNELGHELGLGCSLLQDEDFDLDEGGSGSGSDLFLANNFKALICRSIGAKVIQNFATSGNVNSQGLEPEVGEKIDNFQGAMVEQFEAECGAQLSDRNYNHQLDHDSVQLEGSSENAEGVIVIETTSNETALKGKMENESCRKQLDLLTLEYLEQVLESESLKEAQPWRVFNVFSQQMATFGGSQKVASKWILESLGAAAAAKSQERDRFERKIAFWANFIPTLDCSRTQPISASSLSLSQTSNATLLNMNLDFNCQQSSSSSQVGGHGVQSGIPQTANALLHSIGTRAKLALSDFLSSLAKQQQQQQSLARSRGSSHHSLRMAANETQQQQLDEPLVSKAPTNRQLNSSLGSWLELDNQQELTPAAMGNGSASLLALLFTPASKLATNSQLSQRALMSLWLLGGAAILIGSLLLTSGGFVLLARRRRRRRKEHAAKQRKQSATIDQHNEQDLQQQQPNFDFGPRTDLDLVQHQMVLPNGHAHLNHQIELNQDLGHQQEQTPGNSSQLNNFIEYNQQQLESAINHRESPQQQILLPILTAPRNFREQQLQTGSQAHLVGCNLLQDNTSEQLIQQRQQQALSSSSETTTATSTNRAHSSVSLVSSSTNTTTTIANQPINGGGNNNNNQPKKRVKISDPKRRIETSTGYLATSGDNYLSPAGDLSPLYLNSDGLLAPLDLQLQQLDDGQSNQFCPIHRANSSNYLIQTNPGGASTSFVTTAAAAGLENGWHTQAYDSEQLFQHSQQHTGLATVGSLAEYLNLTAMGQDQNNLEEARNSLRMHATMGRKSRRQQQQQASRLNAVPTTAGLCQVHSDQANGIVAARSSSTMPSWDKQ